MEGFSVAIIAKDEAKSLPNLLESLKGVEDIVVVDTGSTDDTVKIAKKFKCRVKEVGDKFIENPTQKDIDTFVKRYGFTPSFTTKTKLFNYAKARNYSMSLTENDFVFFPDADEVVKWDIDGIKKLLPDCDQLKYRFCYNHNEDGTCSLEFTHCKFFRKSKSKWVKKVHEVVQEIEKARVTYTDKIYLDHWQIPSDNRTNYLEKLEYSVLEDENDDRNHYYLAREYLFAQDHKKSLQMFEKYLTLKGWRPERGQAMAYMATCYDRQGQADKAIEMYHKSMIEDDTRREPLWELALLLERLGRKQSAIQYLEMAVSIPFQENYYLNNVNLYTWQIHDKLSLLYRGGEKARYHWLEALKAAPNNERILNNGKWFMK